MRSLLAILTFAMLLVRVANPQDTATRVERFELYNACNPVGLLIEALPADVKDLGLTEGALHEAAASRLRAQDLYVDHHSVRIPLKVNTQSDSK